MKPKSRTLTEAELEIMQVIWDLERGTVRDVFDVLRERKQIAYTTVMTMMKILEDKGHLSRTKEGRAFLYEPVRSKDQMQSTMVDDFVSRVFEGSARPLVLSLIKDRKISRNDLEEISRMIEESE